MECCFCGISAAILLLRWGSNKAFLPPAPGRSISASKSSRSVAISAIFPRRWAMSAFPPSMSSLTTPMNAIRTCAYLEQKYREILDAYRQGGAGGAAAFFREIAALSPAAVEKNDCPCGRAAGAGARSLCRHRRCAAPDARQGAARIRNVLP